MKLNLLTVSLILIAACNSKTPDTHNTENTDLVVQEHQSVNDYKPGKTIAEVMDKLVIKDTTGKTFYAKLPMLDSTKMYLIIKEHDGTLLAFDNNKLVSVIPPVSN